MLINSTKGSDADGLTEDAGSVNRRQEALFSRHMSEADLVTVYRSGDNDAETDATEVHELLLQSGLNPVLLNDSEPGVISGSWEVRVPHAEVVSAEDLINFEEVEELDSPDPSAELDSVTIADLQGTTGEIEAMGIKSILDASGIPNFISGASTLPSLSFLVKVPASDVEAAKKALAEAAAAGPAAAVEAERESEGMAPPQV